MGVSTTRRASARWSFLRLPLVWTLVVATGMFLGVCDLLGDGGGGKSAQTSVLERYVNASTSAYSWEKVGETSVNGVECAELRLTSQRWRGIRREHQLLVARPAVSCPTDHGIQVASHAVAAVVVVFEGRQGTRVR